MGLIGIQNVTAASLNNLTDLANVSSYPEFAINVNHDIYGGWLYFIILMVLWIILFYKLNERDEQILPNIMYTSALLSIASLFLRAIEITRNGVILGLITDSQLWIFPLVAIV